MDKIFDIMAYVSLALVFIMMLLIGLYTFINAIDSYEVIVSIPFLVGGLSGTIMSIILLIIIIKPENHVKED